MAADVAQRPTMRAQMVETATALMAGDERLAVVLADISADLFAEAGRRFPGRVINVGIMEQTMVGVAAGLAAEGLIPLAHSITPFLVSRPFEQLKDDFCYQRLGGNFVSTGASYDYGTSGMTHHGPEDGLLLRALPGMRILVPGAASEVDRLLRQGYDGGVPTYYRTSAGVNTAGRDVELGRLHVERRGSAATVVAVGPMLDRTLEAVADLDVTVLYCTTAAPLDADTLRSELRGERVIVVEPWYEGTLAADVVAALAGRTLRLISIGVPRRVISAYGSEEEHDRALGLTAEAIGSRIARFMV